MAELPTAAEELMPNVSRHHTEMVFASNRAGVAGATDIYTPTWDPDTGRWSGVSNVVSVNTAAPESRPSLSGDGTRLYFGRGAPPGDIYVSTRLKIGDDD